MIVSTQLTPHVSRWTRPAYVMAAGLVIAAAGCVLVCVGGLSESLFTVLGGFTLACVGIAPPTVLGTELVVGSAPPERAASASSVSATSNGFVIALGVATLGSVGTAVYRARLEIPGSVSPELAAVARAVPMITNLADSSRPTPLPTLEPRSWLGGRHCRFDHETKLGEHETHTST